MRRAAGHKHVETTAKSLDASREEKKESEPSACDSHDSVPAGCQHHLPES